MVFSLFVRPEIKTIEQMRGKKIGITRFGSAPDISIRYALRKYNINPDKDLTLMQLGFMATVAAGPVFRLLGVRDLGACGVELGVRGEKVIEDLTEIEVSVRVSDAPPPQLGPPEEH